MKNKKEPTIINDLELGKQLDSIFKNKNANVVILPSSATADETHEAAIRFLSQVQGISLDEAREKMKRK